MAASASCSGSNCTLIFLPGDFRIGGGGDDYGRHAYRWQRGDALHAARREYRGEHQDRENNCIAGIGTDTILFNVSGTITLGSSLPSIANIQPDSLTSDGSGQAITVDGAGAHQILLVLASATLKLRFLTLNRGNELGTPALGGAIYNAGRLTVTNCAFSDNHATGAAFDGTGESGDGGAIFNNNTATIVNSSFSNNHAVGDEVGASSNGLGAGGAIYNNLNATVINSTFSGNQATGNGAANGEFDLGGGEGGAVFTDGTEIIIIAGTFSANQATGDQGTLGAGGAIFSNTQTLNVTNSTLAGNQAIGAAPLGGAIFKNSGTVSLKSTILASSSTDNCAAGAVADAGYNISDDNSCGFSGTSVNSSTTLNLDPAGLQNNGGPTDTIALAANSEHDSGRRTNRLELRRSHHRRRLQHRRRRLVHVQCSDQCQ